MSTVAAEADGTARPLIALVCSVPLLAEGLRSALEFAEVRAFSGDNGDTPGLLRWVRPDAVIVDSERGADDAAAFAQDRDVPVVHISVRNQALRLFHRGGWTDIAGGEDPTPEAIRNVVAGTLFAREAGLP
jgi:DNA-binding NarL/FixJ family response regulator